MNKFGEISIYIVCGLVITVLSSWLDSTYLFDYLKNNILSMILTLLAINTATSGLIASKIQDIKVAYPSLNFSRTIKEMKISLLEQIIMICISIIVLVVCNSTQCTFEYKEVICGTILSGVFVGSIHILWDTGKAVFVIIEEIEKLNQK